MKSNPYDREEELKLFYEVCSDLQHIHDIKSSTYQDSWCKRGEVLSVFGNIARKFDRLEKICSDPEVWLQALNQELNESVEDTVIDLAVYSVLWCAYIKKHRPEVYDECVKRAAGNK